MAVLRASNLAKSYKQKKVVLDVSLEIRSGEIVGLLGPNGAGKTTCFYMIVGLVPSDRGRITIDSQDITPLPMHGRARKGIGYLPQEASVFRKLTVRDNIMAILETRKGMKRPEREAKLEELLEEFHITHIRDSMARALAMEPAFILLDEPFAGVDPISVSDIKHIIRHLRDKGIGVLITDHNVRETLDICENAYIVSGGHIIASGNAEAILANQQVKEVYLGDEFHL
jgi:lipopolysaccharide export system ATP-binding protein